MNRLAVCAVLSVAAILGGLPARSVAQEPAPEELTGLKVGEEAPVFELNNQTGTKRPFDSLRGESDYVALVFYRSADW